MAEIGKNRKPQRTRYSLYIEPELDELVLKHKDKIIEDFGSVNAWMNRLMSAWLKKQK